MTPELLRALATAAGAMPLGEDHFIFTADELARFLALAREQAEAPRVPPLPY